MVEHPFEKYGGQIGIFSSSIGVNILQIFETTTNVFVELLLMVQKSCEHQLILGINHHYLPRVSKTSHPWLFKYPHYLPKGFQKPISTRWLVPWDFWSYQPLNHHQPPPPESLPPEANVGNLWFESEPSCWQPYPHRPGRLFGKLNELRGFCRLDFLPVGFHLSFNTVAWNKPRLAPKKRGSSYPIHISKHLIFCV